MRIEKQLDEAFQNFEYKTPDDPELILYDFYFMTVIAKNADLSQEPDIEWIVKDSVVNIVENLYIHMNRALKWSLTCEIRHIFDSVFKPSSSEAQKAFKKHPQFTMEFYNSLKTLKTGQELPSYLKSISNIAEFSSELASRFEQDPMVYKDNDKERETANAAIKMTQRRLGINNRELAEIYEDFYNSDSWRGGYGGKNWARIAIGWQKLQKAKKINDKIIWIDHAYDLQHNTDTVFNKIRSYSKSGGYGWLGRALDWKRDVTDVRQFYFKVSPQLKRLVAYIAKAEYGLTIGDFKGVEKPKFNTPIPSGYSGYNYETPKSNPLEKFSSVFTASNLKGAGAKLTDFALDILDWENSGYGVHITAYLLISMSNSVSSVEELSNHTFFKNIEELSKVVIPDADILFGSPSGNNISIKKGKFLQRPGTTVEDVQNALSNFKVGNDITVKYIGGSSENLGNTGSSTPSWVIEASGGSEFYKVGVDGNEFSSSWPFFASLDSWGLTKISKNWKHQNVWVSKALVNLFNQKYTKIKWVFNLDLENVYIHYDRNKDEAEVIGNGPNKSSVEGWWKKGSLKLASFKGTWNQGSFIQSTFDEGTWIKGYFHSSSTFVSGTFKKHPATVYHGAKGGYPDQDDPNIIVESSSISKEDLYLQEDSVQTQLRTRSGWV